MDGIAPGSSEMENNSERIRTKFLWKGYDTQVYWRIEDELQEGMGSSTKNRVQ